MYFRYLKKKTIRRCKSFFFISPVQTLRFYNGDILCLSSIRILEIIWAN